MKRHADPTPGIAPERQRHRRLATILGVGLTALAIVGCGSTLSSSQGPVVAGAIQAPSLLKDSQQVRAAVGHLRHAKRHARHAVRVNLRPHAGAQPRVIAGNPVHAAAIGTGGTTLNDDYQGRSDDAGPCELISRARAAALLHHAVDSPRSAPLGPSCIYRESGTRTQVVLTVQSASYASFTRHLPAARPAVVAGHRAVCAGGGAQLTFVSLSAGRVLTVTGACATGERFAAAALGG